MCYITDAATAKSAVTTHSSSKLLSRQHSSCGENKYYI